MIHLEQLHFGYQKKVPLFENLSLKLESGHIYGLFGVNGAGKTSLIRLIGGLLTPHRGQVLTLGYQARKRHVDMLGDLYVIPEEVFVPAVSIKKYVAIHSCFYKKFCKETLESVLADFEIDEKMQLSHLSYGQKKKFLIAFAIATNTSVLLMDEPINGLDIPSKSQFRKIMVKYMNSHRCVLVSTHQARDLSSIIDHMLIIHKGQLIFNESVAMITDKLKFELLEQKDDNVFYGEEVFGGWACISKNQGQPGRIDFELLFNGIIKKGDFINQYIKGGINENGNI